MDAIKKKMLAMKMDKENALDRADQMEQKLRDTEEQKAKVRDGTLPHLGSPGWPLKTGVGGGGYSRGDSSLDTFYVNYMFIGPSLLR